MKFIYYEEITQSITFDASPGDIYDEEDGGGLTDLGRTKIFEQVALNGWDHVEIHETNLSAEE